MIVSIDIDDVCLPLMKYWLYFYNEKYRDELVEENITDWNIAKFCKCGTKIYDFLSMPNLNLYYGIDPYDDALPYIKRIRDLNHRIIFVTGGDYQNRKLNWLFEHKFITTDYEYVCAKDKQLIESHIIVDDKYETVVNFDGFGILVDRPWNRKYNNVCRSFNWKQTYSLIKGYSL